MPLFIVEKYVRASHKYFIEVKDFLRVSELLNIRVVEVKEEVHLFEKICPAIYLSWFSVKIRKMVCHK